MAAENRSIVQIGLEEQAFDRISNNPGGGILDPQGLQERPMSPSRAKIEAAGTPTPDVQKGLEAQAFDRVHANPGGGRMIPQDPTERMDYVEPAVPGPASEPKQVTLPLQSEVSEPKQVTLPLKPEVSGYDSKNTFKPKEAGWHGLNSMNRSYVSAAQGMLRELDIVKSSEEMVESFVDLFKGQKSGTSDLNFDAFNPFEGTVQLLERVKEAYYPSDTGYVRAEGWRGVMEDIVGMGPQITSQMALGILSGGTTLAPTALGAVHMGGATYDSLYKEVGHDRAMDAAIAVASVNSVLEKIGLEAAFKGFKPNKAFKQRIVDLVGAVGTEAATEYLQKFPEYAAELWAKTEGKSLTERSNLFMEGLWDANSEALYEGFLGGVAGGGIHTGASTISGAQSVVDKLLSKDKKLTPEQSSKNAEINKIALEIRKKNLDTSTLQGLIKDPEFLEQVFPGATTESVEALLNERTVELQKSREFIDTHGKGSVSKAASLGLRGLEAEAIVNRADQRDDVQISPEEQASLDYRRDANKPRTPAEEERAVAEAEYQKDPGSNVPQSVKDNFRKQEKNESIEEYHEAMRGFMEEHNIPEVTPETMTPVQKESITKGTDELIALDRKKKTEEKIEEKAWKDDEIKAREHVKQANTPKEIDKIAEEQNKKQNDRISKAEKEHRDNGGTIIPIDFQKEFREIEDGESIVEYHHAMVSSLRKQPAHFDIRTPPNVNEYTPEQIASIEKYQKAVTSVISTEVQWQKDIETARKYVKVKNEKIKKADQKREEKRKTKYQEISESIETHGKTGGILVKGDPVVIREKLVAAGIQIKGSINKKKGGLTFSGKRAEEIRGVLGSPTETGFRQAVSKVIKDTKTAQAVTKVMDARAKSLGMTTEKYLISRGIVIVTDSKVGTDKLRQENKGAIDLSNEGQAIIHVFKKADASTILHELGHIFRRDLTGKDLVAVEKWAGVKNGKWNNVSEEKFARGWENYLTTGKAPIKGLQIAFDKIKKVMLDIYGAISHKDIDINISPEVRAVFDNMLTPATYQHKPRKLSKLYKNTVIPSSEEMLFQTNVTSVSAPDKNGLSTAYATIISGRNIGKDIQIIHPTKRDISKFGSGSYDKENYQQWLSMIRSVDNKERYKAANFIIPSKGKTREIPVGTLSKGCGRSSAILSLVQAGYLPSDVGYHLMSCYGDLCYANFMGMEGLNPFTTTIKKARAGDKNVSKIMTEAIQKFVDPSFKEIHIQKKNGKEHKKLADAKKKFKELTNFADIKGLVDMLGEHAPTWVPQESMVPIVPNGEMVDKTWSGIKGDNFAKLIRENDAEFIRFNQTGDFVLDMLDGAAHATMRNLKERGLLKNKKAIWVSEGWYADLPPNVLEDFFAEFKDDIILHASGPMMFSKWETDLRLQGHKKMWDIGKKVGFQPMMRLVTDLSGQLGPEYNDSSAIEQTLKYILKNDIPPYLVLETPFHIDAVGIGNVVHATDKNLLSVGRRMSKQLQVSEEQGAALGATIISHNAQHGHTAKTTRLTYDYFEKIGIDKDVLNALKKNGYYAKSSGRDIVFPMTCCTTGHCDSCFASCGVRANSVKKRMVSAPKADQMTVLYDGTKRLDPTSALVVDSLLFQADQKPIEERTHELRKDTGSGKYTRSGKNALPSLRSFGQQKAREYGLKTFKDAQEKFGEKFGEKREINKVFIDEGLDITEIIRDEKGDINKRKPIEMIAWSDHGYFNVDTEEKADVYVKNVSDLLERGASYPEAISLSFVLDSETDGLLFQKIQPVDTADKDDAMWDLLDIKNDNINDILENFGKFTPWKPTSYEDIKDVWSDFITHGKVRNPAKLDRIAQQVINNIMHLDVITELAGHTQSDPFEMLEEYGIDTSNPNETTDRINDTVVNDDGNMMISDYGIEPLLKHASNIITAETSEKRLKYIDRVLNEVHARFDLADLFIEGGVDSLNKLFDAGIETGDSEIFFQSDQKPVDTESKNFKRWFGDSKVVDENDKPLVVYHGTKGNFTEFTNIFIESTTNAPSAKKGFFFTSSPIVASGYSALEGETRITEIERTRLKEFKVLSDQHDAAIEEIWEAFEDDRKYKNYDDFIKGEKYNKTLKSAFLTIESFKYVMFNKGSVIPTYLSFANPYVIDFKGKKYRKTSYNDLLKIARKNDYDSLIIKNTFDGALIGEYNEKTNIYIAFEPTQIKSALTNIGEFSKKNPKIFMQSAQDPGYKKWSKGHSQISGDQIGNAKSNQGYVFKVYHGTTHEFSKFDPTITGNKEGALGAVNYFTSDQGDADINYAGEGPDLTGRIEELSERIYEDIQDYDIESKDDFADAIYNLNEDFNTNFPTNKPLDLEEVSNDIAKEQLSGDEPSRMDLFVRLDNPAFINGKTDTWIENDTSEQYRKDAEQEMRDVNDATDEEIEDGTYDDEIREYMDESAMYDELPIKEAINDAIREFETDVDAIEVYQGLELYDPEVSANELYKALNESETLSYAQDFDSATGENIGSHLIGQIFKNLGFDGIVLQNANKAFPGMDMGTNTSHVHVFEETPGQIKSQDKNVGAYDETKGDIYMQSAPRQTAREKMLADIKKKSEIQKKPTVLSPAAQAQRKIVKERPKRTVLSGAAQARRKTKSEVMEKGGFGKREKVTIKERINKIREGLPGKLRQAIVDPYHSFRYILGDRTSWMMAHLTQSSSSALMGLINDGSLRLDESGAIARKKDSKSLKDILKPLGDEHMGDFFKWIAGHRAERLSKIDLENLFDEGDINVLKNLNEGREELFDSVRADFEKMSADVMDIAVGTGLVDREQADLWEEEGFYVPFYRMMDEGVRGPTNGSGLVGKKAFHKLKGSERKIDDLLSNVLLNWNHLITAGLQNQAGSTALKAAVEKGYFEPVNSHTKGKKAVYVMEGGKQQWYQPTGDSFEHQMILESLQAITYSPGDNTLWKLARVSKRALTVGVTVNPGFIIRNLIRDTIHSPAVSKQSKNIFMNVAVGFNYDTTDMSIGGGAFGESGYTHGGDPDAVKQMVSQGVSRDNILNTTGKLKKLWKGYKAFGAKAENINRVATYEQAIADGKSLLEANFLARDLLDFTRMGTSGTIRALAQTVPFLNARLQGLDKMARAGMDKNQRTQFAQVIGTYVVLSLGLALLMGDDDEYNDAEEWEHRVYHLFKLPGTDQMFYLPRPFEVGAIGYMAEQMTKTFFDKNQGIPELRSAFTHTLLDTFSMNPVPQLVKPGLEVFMNKSFFTERGIESRGVSGFSTTERSQPWTSPIAIQLSKAMSMGGATPDLLTASPMQIEHIVRGYTGWLGMTVLGAADGLYNLATDRVTPDKKWYESRLFPFSSLIRNDAKSNKYVEKFYDNMREYNEAYKDIKKYKDTPDGQKEYLKFMQNYTPRNVYNKINVRMSKKRKKMRNIELNDRYDKYQKRDKIKVLRKEINTMAKETVKKYEND